MKILRIITTFFKVTKKNWKKIVAFIVFLAANYLASFIVDFISKIKINPESALEFFSASAQISATIFSIFSAFVFLIIEKENKDLREIIPKGYFVVTNLLFAFAIVWSLVNIVGISQSEPVSLREITVELGLVVFGILMLLAFIWDYYARKSPYQSSQS